MISNKQKVVAIIDDDPGMRYAAESLLSGCGYGTEVFDSAEAFLNAAAISEADCLLVDIQLGDISGLELAQQLTADGYRFPIIFMTGLDSEMIKSQAEAAGCVAFLEKPFPSKLLLDAVKKAIGQAAG